MGVRRSWGIIGVLSFLVTASTVWAAHDEARFGKALAFQKVEGITACSAVQVVDIADVTHPKMIRSYSIIGHPGACAFWKGRLVVPAGYEGLLLSREPSILK